VPPLDGRNAPQQVSARFSCLSVPALDSLRSLIESRRFDAAITALIVVNAITLGLETSEWAMSRFGGLLHLVDSAILAVFVLELAARIVVYRQRFFHDPWRIFDLAVVAFALVPATGNLSVLRALRILRVLRLISIVPSLRRVVTGFITALPGMGSIILLMGLVFYVFGVMATKLYGDTFPEQFGELHLSIYTLFQVMTLEGWSDGVVRPIMAVHPYAWAFFIPFIVATAFTVLNLFTGVIVAAMEAEHDAVADAQREEMRDDQDALMAEIKALRAEVRALAAKK
jgi:voltage-gated sodium channel